MNKHKKNNGFIGMLVILLAGMVATSLNQSVINIALPRIMMQFKINALTVQWLTTAYMLISGILVPVSAYLSQRFSYKQLFITAMAFFTAGSLICAISPGFEVLLIGRVFQSVGGGILIPLSMNIFMSAFPVEKRGSAMGLLGLGMILAPALGPTISGYVIEYYNWNVLFYAMTVIGFIILVAAFRFFRFESERGNAKLDVAGVMLSSIGFGALLYGVSEISGKGWDSPEVIVCLVISIISLTAFAIYSQKKENPLLELKVFKDSNFTFTIIVNLILSFSGRYGTSWKS